MAEDSKIYTPFTDEQVEKLNQFQKSEEFHPFTCCSPEDILNCERKKGISEGILIAKNEGWICPCGNYTQNWFWKFMLSYNQEDYDE